MNAIDVSDLPEPVARAIESVVNAFRQQYQDKPNRNGDQARGVEFPTAPGRVLGSLRRVEIYEDER